MKTTIFVEHQKMKLEAICHLREWPSTLGQNPQKKWHELLSVFYSMIKGSQFSGFSIREKKIESISLALHLCGDQRMRTLNRQYRDRDKTTDVLSFPLFDNLRGGNELMFGPLELGDIFISYPVLAKQAKEFGVTEEQEFYHLITHGFLHLLGYDHELSAREEELMEKFERQIVKKIYKAMGMK